jgi:hypothetical protein
MAQAAGLWGAIRVSFEWRGTFTPNAHWAPVYTADKGKVKVQLSVCLWLSTTSWRRIGEWRYSSTHSLTSARRGGDWSASRPGRFTPRKEPRYPLDRSLGGPQSRSGRGGEEKNSQPPPGIEPWAPIVQPVAQRYTDWATCRASYNSIRKLFAFQNGEDQDLKAILLPLYGCETWHLTARLVRILV